VAVPWDDFADWDERFRKAHPNAWGLGDYVVENIMGVTINGVRPKYVLIRDGEVVGAAEKRRPPPLPPMPLRPPRKVLE